MNQSRSLNFLLVVQAAVLAPQAFATLTFGTPTDVIGSLSPATFVADGYGTNSYKDWGNEPSIAVNPGNPNQIVVSSFSYSTSSTASGANIFYTADGGTTWTSQFTVPAPSSGVGIPNDWRFAYDSGGTLHGLVLGGCSTGCNVYQGSTADPTSLAAWSWTGAGAKINNAASLNNADQPWIAVAGGGKVFAAYDDFHSGVGIRMATSSNNGVSFPVDTSMNNGAVGTSVNPGTRIATDGSGNVYGVFTIGSGAGPAGVQNVTYYLNRSHDGGATWDFNASSVVGGIVVGSGVSDQLDNPGTQASNNWFAGVNDLRGSYTAVASDSTGSHVYVVWGKRDIGGVDRIYMTEYHPSGGGGLAAGATTIMSVTGEWAALPSVTVLADGTVIVMYDSFDGTKVHVHVASSTDFGASVASDTDMYSFTPLTLLAATGSAGANREFGDYQFVVSVGNSFYGSFVARGNNSFANDTTSLVDPFFFSGTDSAVPEPASLVLLGSALVALGLLRRRRR